MTQFVLDRLGRRRALQPGEILKDGETLVVPMRLMDATQRAVAESTAVIDAYGRMRGFAAVPSTTATEARDAAFVEQGDRLKDAWRNPGAARTVTGTADAGSDPRQAAWAAEGLRLRDAWRSAQ